MASFLSNIGGNVGNLVGGNPFSTPVGQRIERATDPSLASEDWNLNMEICDIINETEEGARDAVKAIKKRLATHAGKNHTVVLYTLTVLETCVKNCGHRLHVLVTHKEFGQELVKIIQPKNDPPQIVQERVLGLIQTWADAFRGKTDTRGVVEVYNELKGKGIEFPMTDLDTLSPIHTPQRTQLEQPAQPPAQPPLQMQPPRTAQGQPASYTGPAPYPPPGGPVTGVVGAPVEGPVQLGPEQLAKLRSELDVLRGNVKVFSEMLTELTPAQASRDDVQLLLDLNKTCKAMQARVVDLIPNIATEVVKAATF